MATISRRGDRWVVQVRRKGVPSSNRTFRTQAEAKSWAASEEARIDRAEPVTPRRLLAGTTFGDILRRYREEVTPFKRSGGVEEPRLRQLERDQISMLPLSRLDSGSVAGYRDRRLKTVKPATVRRELAIISHTIEVARKEWGYLMPVNPVKEIRQPTMGEGRSRRVTSAEWQRLVDAVAKCRNKFVFPFIQFAIQTAMRRGELVALRWDQINLDRRTLLIPEAKNGYSRTIPLTDEAIQILFSLPHRDGSVFRISTNGFKLSWSRILVRSKIENLHFHDLRHEAISRFAEMGLTTVELAAISGHRDLRMLARYTHIQPSALARKLAGRSWEQEVREM